MEAKGKPKKEEKYISFHPHKAEFTYTEDDEEAHCEIDIVNKTDKKLFYKVAARQEPVA